MTELKRTAWLALYAAAWFQPVGCSPGVVTDLLRATVAAEQADRGLEALRQVRPEILR